MRTLWRLRIELEITVKQSTGGRYEMLLLMSFRHDDKQHTPALTKLVQAFYRDEFNFKRYVRTLGGIHTWTDGTFGLVTYVSPRSFVLSRDDYRKLPRLRDVASLENYTLIVAELCESVKPVKHLPQDLLTLPTCIIGKIMEYVHGDLEEESKTVNLEDDAERLDSLGPYPISKLWRHYYGEAILMSRRYKFEVTTTVQREDFPGFYNLDRISQTPSTTLVDLP
jgi:hypothetical protein